MGGLSWMHWALVLAVVLLLFGGNKISGLMGDFAKGIKAFKTNMKEDEKDASMTAESAPPAPATGTIAAPAAAATAAAQPAGTSRPAA